MQINSTIFKTIETGDTTKIVTSIQARKIAQEELNTSLAKQISVLESDKLALTDLESKIASGIPYEQAFAQSMTNASVAAKEHAIATKGAAGSTDTFVAKQKIAQAELKATATAAKGASIAMKALSVVGNMLLFTAITTGINLVAKAIDNYIHKSEIMLEKAEEASNKIQETNSTLESHKKTVEECAKTYEKLSKGVDTLSNKNISLSDEDYEEYLRVTNELAEVFPQLRTTIDENGNSIIQFSDKTKTATENLEAFLEQEKQTANYKIAQSLPDLFGGILVKKDELDKANSQYEELSNSVSEYIKQLEAVKNISNTEVFKVTTDTSEAGIQYFNALSSSIQRFQKTLPDAQKELFNFLDYVQTDIDGVSTITLDFSMIDSEQRETLQEIINEEFAEIGLTLNDNVNDFKTELNGTQSEFETSWIDFRSNLVNAMHSKASYQGLDSVSKQLANELVGNLSSDIVSEMDSEDPYSWVSENIISNLRTIDDENIKKEFQSKIEELLSFEDGDLNVVSFSEELQRWLDANGIYIDITPIIKDEKDAKNSLQKSIESIVGSKVSTYDSEKKQLTEYTKDFTEAERQHWLTVTNGIVGADNAIKAYEDSLSSSNISEPKIFNPSSFSESIQQLSSLQKLYNDFYNNVQDGVSFTFDISEIESLREKFGEVCDSFDEFEKLATSSSTSAEDMQKAFDKLASEFIFGTNVLDGLNVQTREQILTQLELQGIVGANSIITEEFAQAIGDASEKNIDFANSVNSEINSLIDEGNYSEDTKNKIIAYTIQKRIANENSLSTVTDIAELQALCENLGIASESIMWFSRAKALQNQVDAGEDSALVLKQLDLAKEKCKELASQISVTSTSYTGMSQSASNAAKSAKKSAKDTGDAYVEAYEKELEKLKDLKENGLISEKEYLDRSRVLYEKYFKGIEKYAKNFADAQREYLKGILDYYNKAISAVGSVIDKRTKELEKQKNAEVKGYNDQIKYLDELVKSLDDQIDAKQKEIDAINDAADARKRELDVQKAQYEFLKAQQQRTSLLYKDGQMVYEQNATNVRDKKTELEDAEREYRIGQLEKEKELIEQQKDAYEKQKESFEEMIQKTEEYFDKMINSLNEYKDRWDELSDIQSQAESLAILKEFGYTTEDILAMSDSAFESFKSDYLSILADMNSGNEGFLESLAKLGNVEGISGLGSFLANTQSQIDTLAATTFTPLEDEFSKVGSSVNDTKDKVSELSNQIDGGGGEKSKSNGYAGNGDPLAGGGKKSESSSLKSSIENETETALSSFGEQANELNENVSPAITNAKNEMDRLNESASKPIEKTITIKYKVKTTGGGGRKFEDGTVGNAFASGTGKYKGLANDEKNALRSEYGQPELTVYPDGNYEITTEPVISDLPKDTVIFNEEQTHKILNNSGKSVSSKSFADGTITLASGTTLTPIQPEDSGYKLVKIAEQLKSQMVDNMIPSFDLIGKNVEIMASNISKINNNNRQIVNTIQNVNVNCTGVTSQEVAQQIGTELQKTFSGMSLNAYQKMSVTR